MSRIFIFGLGYTASVLAQSLQRKGWAVTGTVRGPGTAAALAGRGMEAMVFDGKAPAPELGQRLDGADHILVSVPPAEEGDPVLGHHRGELRARAGAFRWLGYLSTVGIYGDHAGDWVDEETPPRPSSGRSRRRLIAERAWGTFAEESGVPLTIFRIAGIYGPGRNALVALRRGEARRVVKRGQVFNRVHVDDLATVLEASISRPLPGIYNVADDAPAPPQDVVAFAAQLLGVAPPPETAFATAEMTEMARSFYGENKRVRNARIKDRLGAVLAYPDYRAGLEALYAAGEGR